MSLLNPLTPSALPQTLLHQWSTDSSEAGSSAVEASSPDSTRSLLHSASLNDASTVDVFSNWTPEETAEQPDCAQAARLVAEAITPPEDHGLQDAAKSARWKKALCLGLSVAGLAASVVATVLSGGAAWPTIVVASLCVGVASADMACAIRHCNSLQQGGPGLAGGHDSLNNLGRMVAGKLGADEKKQAQAGSLLSLCGRGLLCVASAVTGTAISAVAGSSLSVFQSVAQGVTAGSSSGLFFFRGYHDPGVWKQQEKVHAQQEQKWQQAHALYHQTLVQHGETLDQLCSQQLSWPPEKREQFLAVAGALRSEMATVVERLAQPESGFRLEADAMQQLDQKFSALMDSLDGVKDRAADPLAMQTRALLIDPFLGRSAGESALLDDPDEARQKIEACQLTAQKNMQKSSKKAIWERVFGLAVALGGVAASLAVTVLTGGAAGPTVAVALLSTGVAIADVACALLHHRSLKQGGTGLAGGDDSLRNLGEVLAKKMGGSEERQAQVGTWLSLGTRGLLMGLSVGVSGLLPSVNLLPLTMFKAAGLSALSAISHAVQFYRGYHDERIWSQHDQAYQKKLALWRETHQAEAALLERQTAALVAVQHPTATLGKTQRDALLGELAAVKDEMKRQTLFLARPVEGVVDTAQLAQRSSRLLDYLNGLAPADPSGISVAV
jgi:hypothetical protein